MSIKSRSLAINLNSLARLVSLLFLPPAFSLFTFTYLHIVFEQGNQKFLSSLLLSILATVIIPIFVFLIQRKKGNITDNDAVNKEQRNLTFIILIFVYLASSILLYLIDAYSYIVILMIAYSINTLFVLLINQFFKISIHTFTVIGSAAVFWFVSEIVFLLFIFSGLLVGWSRIKLGVHSKSEVFFGMILGFFLTYFEFKILLHLYEAL
ncbi:MAG: hypothetical protein N3A61_06200 [Ignavibacteria bacterium]|nr:hypothetical protein [Ignavibacteria bacterium]